MSYAVLTQEEKLADFRARAEAFQTEFQANNTKQAKRKRAKQAARAQALRKKQRDAEANKGGRLGLMGYPAALVIGAASVLAGRVAAFHYPAGSVAEDDLIGTAVVMGGDLGVALALSALLAWIARLNKVQGGVAVAAFVGVMLFEVDLMAQFPDVWAQVFSPEYVAATLAEQRGA